MSKPADKTLESLFADGERQFGSARARAGESVCDLRFGDSRVRLRFAGPELAEALLPAFGGRRPGSDADRSAPAAATIDLWQESDVPGEVGRLPWRPHERGPRGLLPAAVDSPVVGVHEDGSGALTLWHRHARRLLYRVPDARRLPWWERAAPMRPGLTLALSRDGQGLVHAGAVGDERGGVLLAGAGGSGKTTVALAALTAGLRYVADDYLLLCGPPDPVAWNVFATAKLDAGHLARFPALAGMVPASWCRDHDEKAVLDVARTHAPRLAEGLALRALVVPRITGGPTELRPIARMRAMLALAPSTVLQMPYERGTIVGVLSAATRTLPCFGLDVGDDPAEIAGALDRVLMTSTGANGPIAGAGAALEAGR